jgi:uncharacterized protein (TIGR02217 family)
METFDIPYREVYQFKSSWSTTVTDLTSGKEQRIANWDSPRRAWEIEMQKTLEIIDQARVFFDARKGKYEAFWFTPPHSDTPVKVRFDTDDFEASITYSAGTFTLKVIEVL